VKRNEVRRHVGASKGSGSRGGGGVPSPHRHYLRERGSESECSPDGGKRLTRCSGQSRVGGRSCRSYFVAHGGDLFAIVYDGRSNDAKRSGTAAGRATCSRDGRFAGRAACGSRDDGPAVGRYSESPSTAHAVRGGSSFLERFGTRFFRFSDLDEPALPVRVRGVYRSMVAGTTPSTRPREVTPTSQREAVLPELGTTSRAATAGATEGARLCRRPARTIARADDGPTPIRRPDRHLDRGRTRNGATRPHDAPHRAATRSALGRAASRAFPGVLSRGTRCHRRPRASPLEAA